MQCKHLKLFVLQFVFGKKLKRLALHTGLAERFKQAAQDMEDLPRVGRDIFPLELDAPEKQIVQAPPEVSLQEILNELSA